MFKKEFDLLTVFIGLMLFLISVGTDFAAEGDKEPLVIVVEVHIETVWHSLLCVKWE